MIRSIFQNKALAWTIILLLVANLALLGYFAFFKGSGDKRARWKKPIVEFVEKKLEFTESQKKAFEEMRTVNKPRMTRLFEDISKAKDSLFQLVLVESLDDSLLYDRSLVIAEKQRAIELEYFRQYKNILAMCSPEQKAKFDTSFLPMVRKMYKYKAPGDSSVKSRE